MIAYSSHPYMPSNELMASIKQQVQSAIAEDVGSGDYSYLACIPESANGGAKLLVKDNGVIAGVALAERIFKHLDKNIQFNLYKSDGETVVYGDVVFEVFGRR